MPTDRSRRGLLRAGIAGAAVALAGCSGGVRGPSATSGVGSTETPASQSPVRTLDGDPFAALRVGSTPETVPFRHAAEFLAQPSAERPARIRVSIRNDSDAPQTIRTSTWKLPFPSALAEARPDAGLVLSQDGDPELTDGCWPTGEYRFSQGYAANPETDDAGYGWRFTLVI